MISRYLNTLQVSCLRICPSCFKISVAPPVIALLTQEKYIALSAQENIGFGNASNMNDMTSIRKAATESGAHDYIRSFESFYKTSLHMEYNSADMPYDFYYDYTTDDTKEDLPS